MILSILIVTVIVSLIALNDGRIFEKLMLSPYRVVHYREWYRVITHGFVHGSYFHLAINMIVFYSFSQAIEQYFAYYRLGHFAQHFFILYFGGMIVATITTIIKHKNNPNYSAIGASGAVAAVMFASIFFNPWSSLYFMGVIPIPGVIFAILYMVYSSYMARKGMDNIGHDAHLYGALFGLIYPIFIHPSLLKNFFYLLTHPVFNF